MVTKKDVRRCVRFWQKMLGLTNFDIKVGFEVEKSNSIAECSHSGEYEFAILNFNLAVIPNHQMLNLTVVHELLHVVLAPLTANAKTFAGDYSDVIHYLEEQVVTQMEKWPLWKQI